MIAELNHFWKRFLETQAALLEAIDRLPEGRWQWQPAETANPAARIVQHIANGEAFYVSTIRGDHERRVRWEVADRVTAVEAVTSAAHLVGDLSEELSQADLNRVCAEDWNPLGPPVDGPLDVLWFLEQMIRHKAYHLGQLNYLIAMTV